MLVFSEFREENAELNEIIDRAERDMAVQGVILEIHKTWINLLRLRKALGWDWLRNRFRLWSEDYYSDDRYFFRGVTFEELVDQTRKYFLESEYWYSCGPVSWRNISDLRHEIHNYFRPHFVTELLPPPVIVRMCLRPYMNADLMQTEQLRWADFMIMNEVRPLSFFWNSSKTLHIPFVGGTSIGTGDSDYGTMGGILAGDTGNYYGITCSHVVKDNSNVYHPAKCDAKNHTLLGNVLIRSELVALAEEFYNKRNMANANKVDIAVIKLCETADRKVLEVGAICGIFPDEKLMPQIGVSIMGRSSGFVSNLKLDGEVLFYDFQDDDKKYRFKNLLQVRLDGKVANLIGTPIKNGDSGAWIFTPGADGPCWCGMIIGGYDQTGYAISAETTMDWIKNEGKLDLKLIR